MNLKRYIHRFLLYIFFSRFLLSWVIGGLHEKLFSAFLSINQDHDDDIVARIEQLATLSQTDLGNIIYPSIYSSYLLYLYLFHMNNNNIPYFIGVRNELQTSMPEAVKELQRIDECITPLEKVFCLQEVNSLITKSISKSIEMAHVSGGTLRTKSIDKRVLHIRSNCILIFFSVVSRIWSIVIFPILISYYRYSYTSIEDAAVTTDDLIPLFVFVIIRAKLKHLHTNLYYMENFIFSNIGNSSLG